MVKHNMQIYNVLYNNIHCPVILNSSCSFLLTLCINKILLYLGNDFYVIHSINAVSLKLTLGHNSNIIWRPREETLVDDCGTGRLPVSCGHVRPVSGHERTWWYHLTNNWWIPSTHNGWAQAYLLPKCPWPPHVLWEELPSGFVTLWRMALETKGIAFF